MSNSSNTSMTAPEQSRALASRVESLLATASKGLLAVAAVACAAIFMLTMLAVVMRYVAHSPFRFHDELVGLLVATMAILAFADSLAGNRSIRMTLVGDLLGGFWKRALWILGQAITVVFFVWFLKELYAITAFTMRLHLKTEQARLALSPWFIAAMIGIGLALLVSLLQMFRQPPPPPTMHI